MRFLVSGVPLYSNLRVSGSDFGFRELCLLFRVGFRVEGMGLRATRVTGHSVEGLEA